MSQSTPLVRMLWLLGALATVSCPSTKPADSVFVNGKVYTVDAERSWAEAVAVRAGEFVYVGTDDGAQPYIGESTAVADLAGRMLMPGLHDAHTHLLMAGLQWQASCLLSPGAGLDQIVAELRACAQGQSSDEWLVAGVFFADQFPDSKPNKAFLDEAFPNTPVYLHEASLHHALVNSKALELAGVDATTPSPPGGHLLKDEAGELTGELVEMATWLVTQHIPLSPRDVNERVIGWASKQCNKYGITSVQEAAANELALEALKAVDERGELKLRVAAHLILESPKFGNVPNNALEQLFADRNRFTSTHVEVDYAKMWLDGAPIPPYFSEAGYSHQTQQPDLSHVLVPPDELNALVTRLDSAGVKTKMHVAGAGAAHIALNAIEAARKAQPESTVRHETGHSNLIIPADFERYRALNAVAEMSPSVWHLFGNKLGDPPQPAWQFKTLLDSGALMTVGTDWPVTREPNIFPALQGMLQHGEESIHLAAALDALTINGAISVGWQDSQGSIEVGKHANFIVLDRNLFEVQTDEIGATIVLQTVFEGHLVYEIGR